AAQSILGNLIAGVQLAFTDAVRVGDVVVVEGEWGRVGEITLSYVVVYVWDERRLVLPCSYFTSHPFASSASRSSELSHSSHSSSTSAGRPSSCAGSSWLSLTRIRCICRVFARNASEFPQLGHVRDKSTTPCSDHSQYGRQECIPNGTVGP